MSQLAIGYSIKKFIESKMGINAFMKYDGMTYPEGKPFVIVELAPSANFEVSKLRETTRVIFRFQVGLFAESFWERSQFQDEIRRLFLFEKIPLYDLDGSLTGDSFLIKPDFREVPISAEDLSEEMTYHRIYFDLEVEKTYNKTGG